MSGGAPPGPGSAGGGGGGGRAGPRLPGSRASERRRATAVDPAALPRSDPDSVVLCLLAADEADIALQIHFTLIQAFCCANDIHILRASGLERLAAVLGEGPPGGGGAEPRDLHCLLVTVS